MAKVAKTVSTGVRGGFDDLKTRTKLISSFGIVSVIIFVVASSGVLTLRQLSAMSQSVYAGYTIPLADFAEMGTALTHHHQILTGIVNVTNHDDFLSEVARLSSFRKKTNAVIADYGSAVLRVSRSGRDEAKDLAILKPAIEQYFQAADGALSALADSFGKPQTSAQAEHLRNLGILALTVNLQPTFEKVIELNREQVLDMKDVAKDLNDDAQSTGFIGTVVLVLGGLIAVILGIGIAYWIVNFFSKNLIHIAGVAQLAASGNYKVRAKIDSKDEIGQLATSFNAMLDYITTALEKAEGERDELQKRLMVFLVLVSEVGKGDLTKRGEVTADMFGNMADAFNLMIQRFAQLMKQVRASAESVNTSAGMLRDNAGQMAGTAKRQADESVKTLGAVEQLASQMRQVAETAGASSESAKQVLQATEQGRVAVQETVQDMQNIRSAVQRMSKQVKALGDRSLEISHIVSTIRDIANQTNLLALNAAIEAAGAGEAGARFAVVADQVRKLAESSTQATREITDLVKVIQTETQDAVVAMEQETHAVEAGSASALRTGEVFNEISGIAQRSSELAQTIASAAVSQTASTDQVGRSIKEFAGGAITTQKATDSARVTVEDMAKLAEGLTVSVAQFKLV
ncbi:MAG TPA: methyl-accepting chemotaxis protein [Nitrospiraceae bacterium]|nr:methyl-accepting chemotaxis protein [Nitrospiraceae bacterium]